MVSALFFALLPSDPLWLAVPLLASLLLAGIPHGALDQEVGFPMASRWLGLGYVGLAGATLLGWLVAPLAAFVGFLILTWFHWGQGDRHASGVIFGWAHLENPLLRKMHLLVRGALPMLGPLVLFPEVYARVIEATVGLFRSDFVMTLPTGFSWAAGAVLLTLVGSYGVLLLRAEGRSVDKGQDFLETAGLLVLFLFWHPLVSIGLYFIFWHSWRHLVRLTGHVPELRQRVERQAPHRVWLLLGRKVLPNTMGAIVLLVLLGWWSLESLTGVYPAVAVYLVLLACLTVPHTVVVTWMDRRDGLGG